jgi:glyoxylase-like metal-dependent hydrolase (beta-lactamase superfamily II)
MNEVSPLRSDTYEIYAILYGEHAFFPGYLYFWMGNPPLRPQQDLTFISYYYWLIKGPEVNILFDSGITIEGAQALHMEGYQDHRTLLGRMGLSVEDIDTVVFSHLDPDHFEGISAFNFESMQIYMHEEALNFHLRARHYPIMRALNVPSWNEVEIAMKLVEQDSLNLVGVDRGELFEIAPGLSILRTDGHYPGHLSLMVRTEKGPVILAADAAYMDDNLEREWPVGLIRTNLTDAMDVFAMFRKLTAKSGFVVPGHEPKLKERFPEVQERIYRIA